MIVWWVIGGFMVLFTVGVTAVVLTGKPSLSEKLPEADVAPKFQQLKKAIATKPAAAARAHPVVQAIRKNQVKNPALRSLLPPGLSRLPWGDGNIDIVVRPPERLDERVGGIDVFLQYSRFPDFFDVVRRIRPAWADYSGMGHVIGFRGVMKQDAATYRYNKNYHVQDMVLEGGRRVPNQDDLRDVWYDPMLTEQTIAILPAQGDMKNNLSRCIHEWICRHYHVERGGWESGVDADYNADYYRDRLYKKAELATVFNGGFQNSYRPPDPLNCYLMGLAYGLLFDYRYVTHELKIDEGPVWWSNFRSLQLSWYGNQAIYSRESERALWKRWASQVGSMALKMLSVYVEFSPLAQQTISAITERYEGIIDQFEDCYSMMGNALFNFCFNKNFYLGFSALVAGSALKNYAERRLSALIEEKKRDIVASLDGRNYYEALLKCGTDMSNLSNAEKMQFSLVKKIVVINPS